MTVTTITLMPFPMPLMLIQTVILSSMLVIVLLAVMVAMSFVLQQITSKKNY